MKSSKKECYFAGAYTRLSQDDGDKAESDSIRNQKELIKNFPKITFRNSYCRRIFR